MKNLWNSGDAAKCNNDLLKLRVYTSRLLGTESDLVLHGGGNTSVKIKKKNLFGEEEELLYVKGSGWDLATIEAEGFAPVRLDTLKKMANLDHLSDADMVKFQRAAMTNPFAPNPSVEAILHAIIPFTFVDHTHTDAVVTITNTDNGEERIKSIYGDRVLIIPYIMPGFILAKSINDLTQNLDWSSIEGMVLLNHGVFTFHDNPKTSYENMIGLVTEAEEYLKNENANPVVSSHEIEVDPLFIAETRYYISKSRNAACLVQSNTDDHAASFANIEGIENAANRGPITPDHAIRTKRVPVILSGSPENDVNTYEKEYLEYFRNHNNGEQTMLDPAPRWALVPGKGILTFGRSVKENRIISDICSHTLKTIQQAEILGGWKPLPLKELFDMEYWSLEQAKLKKAGQGAPMQGKVYLVTGAYSGIGKSSVLRLVQEGACVIALDINPDIEKAFDQPEVLGLICDLTDENAVRNAIDTGVLHFGGLDGLISNAGIFPPSQSIGEMDSAIWNKSIEINLTSHQQLLTHCLPYLEWGIDPAIVIMGSKNVPAPGPGASAYSVAKAGLNQLARVAALEWGQKGIRINTIHPNSVYDTAIWTDEILKARAGHYGLSVEEYKTNNILKTEITSSNVAELAVQMLGSVFSKTTGAQIPIDGGNERVI